MIKIRIIDSSWMPDNYPLKEVGSRSWISARCLHYPGEITRQVSNEDMLDYISVNFVWKVDYLFHLNQVYFSIYWQHNIDKHFNKLTFLLV